MTWTHSLGGSPLPLPKAEGPFEMEYIPFGVALRSLNCTYHVQLMGAYWRIHINWEGLTKAERDTAFAAYVAYLADRAAYVMPDGLTLTVCASLNSWNENHFYARDGTVRYNVSFQVEQV